MLSQFKIPRTAQHFLECQSEECKSNCEYYCNTCHLPLCKQCRDLHLMVHENKNHTVVLYQERTRQLLEKCKIHPTKETDMLCDECQVSLCSKCATSQEHKGHSFTDLEKIHAEKLAQWQREIDKIHEYHIPTSQFLQNEIKDNAKNIKKIIDNIRESLFEDADLLRSFEETIVTRKMKQIDQIESSLLKDMEIQEGTFTNGNESCDRNEMEDTICSLCGQRKGNQPNISGKEVAFHAYMSSNVQIKTLSKHKIFVYDRVETNVGNGYDVKSGKFTAPESGVYVIHTTTVAVDRSACTIEIVKNGVIKDIGFADAYDHNDRASSSTLTILNLKKGDVVNARAGSYGGKYLESQTSARMSFSGFKLA